MATGTAPRGPQATPPAKKSDGRWIEYDRFIDSQLRKARGQVKGVELAGALMTLAAGGLLYFLLVSLVDHWLVTGGLGFWGRLAFFVLFLAGAAWYIVRRLTPLVILRINPIYAAETIEKSKPSLKNALINFLFLRGEPSGVPQIIYRAVEEQAASSLQRTPIEATVDRTKLVRIGYVLLAIVALSAAYKLFSPKDPIDTIERIVMPWADIQAPTRVTILEVRPGDRTAYFGETVEISAEIRGVGDDEPVRILYTTGDRQTVDQPAVMYRAPDAFRHTGKIPSGEGGLQQDVEYRIEAGDAVSSTYHLQAAAAPTIAVESIDYEFPAYTEKAKSHVENTGDIRALEGTRVTIHGRANQSLRLAQLVLQGEGQPQELPMKIDGRSVTATFSLALDEKDKDRRMPQFSRYQLRPDGRSKPEPAQYKIDVFADLAPEIKFLAPENDEVAVPVNGRLPLELRALDPDYALAEVTLSAELDEKAIIDQRLLSAKHQGPFMTKFIFQPAKLGLKEGDSVSYWATAKDNHTPKANEARTPHRQIRIVKAEQRRPSTEGASNDAKDNPADQKPNPDDNPSKPKNEQQHLDRSPKEKNDQQPPDAQNPDNADTNPKNPNDKTAGDNPKQDHQPESGDEKQGDRKQADQKQGGQNPADQKQGGKQQGDQKQGGGGDKSGDKQDSAGGANASKSSGDDGKGQDQQGSGDSKSGGTEKPDSGSKSSDQPNGDSSKGGQSGTPDGNAANGKEQTSPSNDGSGADAVKTLREALDRQERQGAGGSGQSSNRQSGAPGKNGASNEQQKGGDHAADGSSSNPSNNPQGSGGPFPNGKPGTGSDKPSGDKQHSKPDATQPRGDKPNGDPNAANKQTGNGEKNGNEDKNNAGHQKDGQGPNPGPSQTEKSAGETKPGSDQTSKSGENAAAGDKRQPGDLTPAGDKPKASDQSQTGEKRQPGNEAQDGDKSAGKPQPGEKPQTDKKSQSGESHQPGEKPNQNDRNNGPNGAKPDAGNESSPDNKNSNDKKNSKQDNGAQAKEGSQPGGQKRDQPENGGKQQPDAKGGDPETMKGNASAGQKNSDTKGSPTPQEGNRPKDNKTDVPDNQSPKSSDSSDNAKSPTTSPKESNSQGQQEGDRSGNGKAGGGQSSKQPGTGGAGKNTAADEGAGTSQGAGKGEDSNKAGTDKQSDKATGQSGDKTGTGSKTSDKPSNQGEPSSKSSGNSAGGGAAGNTPQGGGTSEPLPDGASPDNSPINGDEANMDFARKQFDLTLDRLKKGNPDLLKEQNWTRDDARKLVERLEQIKAAAKTSGPEGDRAREQMDDLLRSLGSRAGQLTRGGDRLRNDAQHGVRESNDSGPPAEYQDLFEAFQQGALRGGK